MYNSFVLINYTRFKIPFLLFNMSISGYYTRTANKRIRLRHMGDAQLVRWALNEDLDWQLGFIVDEFIRLIRGILRLRLRVRLAPTSSWNIVTYVTSGTGISIKITNSSSGFQIKIASLPLAQQPLSLMPRFMQWRPNI